MRQPEGYTDRRSAFLGSLERLEQWLGAEQIPYAVFGSVAASAWTDQGASCLR